MRAPDTSFRLIAFGGAMFAVESGFFAVIPPLIPRLVQEVHLTTLEVGVLVAAYPAGVVLGAVPAIALVNRTGVRITTFVGIGMLVLATIVFALGSNGLVLDGARFVQGAGGAVAWAGALAWLTSSSSEARRGTVIGAAVGSALFGTVFGPPVGALAAEVGRGPVFGSLAVVLLLLVVAAPPAPADAGRATARGSARAFFALLRNRQAAVGNVALFVIGVAGGTAWSLTPLLINHLGGTAVTIAWMLAVSYLVAALLNVVVGRLTDRVGRLTPTVILLVLAAALMPWPPLLDSLTPLVVVSVLGGIVLSGLWTPTAAMVADGAESQAGAQAVAVAAMNAAWAAGGTVGPVVMAALAESAGFVLPFAASGALCAAMAVAAVAAYRFGSPAVALNRR